MQARPALPACLSIDVAALAAVWSFRAQVLGVTVSLTGGGSNDVIVRAANGRIKSAARSRAQHGIASKD